MKNDTNNSNAVINSMLGKIQELEVTHELWFREFDDVTDTATCDELKAILVTAPSDAAQYFILGLLSMRTAIQAATGRV